MVGVGTLVLIVGLSRTAGSQIVSHFADRESTYISVSVSEGAAGRGSESAALLPFDASERLAQLNGVVSAGVSAAVLPGARITTVPFFDPAGSTGVDVPVFAVDPTTLTAVASTVGSGRAFDEGHDARAESVAVVGVEAAARLGIGSVASRPTIFIDDRPFTVIGVVVSVQDQARLLNAVMIPTATAIQLFALDAPTAVHIRVEPGAADLISWQAPVALAPSDPSLMETKTAQQDIALRDSVRGDVDSLLVVLGAVSLIAGAIGIANVSLVSVIERTTEIGLRRALGARRTHIAVQFLAEAGIVGGLGGLVGNATAIGTILVVCDRNSWTPVLDTWLPAAAPLLGIATGLAAGIYPAIRAASVEPMAAIREV